MEEAKQLVLKNYKDSAKKINEKMQPVLEQMKPLQTEMTTLRKKTKDDLKNLGLKEREIQRLMKVDG